MKARRKLGRTLLGLSIGNVGSSGIQGVGVASVWCAEKVVRQI